MRDVRFFGLLVIRVFHISFIYFSMKVDRNFSKMDKEKYVHFGKPEKSFPNVFLKTGFTA